MLQLQLIYLLLKSVVFINECKGDPQKIFVKNRFHAGHHRIWCVKFLERCIRHGGGKVHRRVLRINNDLKIKHRVEGNASA